MKRLLTVLLAVTLLLTACGFAGAEQGARKVENAQDAEEWMAVFLGADPGALEGAWELTPQMQAAVSQLGGLQGLAKSLAALGTLQKIGAVREGNTQGFTAYYVPCVFSAMSVDLILVTENGAVAGLSTGPYSGKSTEAEDVAFVSIDLALPVPALDGKLPGTLLLPRGEGPFPAVVLVHGSGASDRDETVGALAPFRDIAEGLARQGIAVYRYDKRTYVYGTLLAGETQLTLKEETVDDAVAAVQLLAGQEKIDPDRIYVLGHSLGGNAIPLIAKALAEQPVSARGFIMMAASPRRLDELMREQYGFLYSLLPEVTDQMQAEKDALLGELDKLNDLDSLTDSDAVAGAYAPYWKYLAAYDALTAAEEIAAPCLLLWGEEDYQVTEVGFAIWQEALGGRENWTLISYPGLTHCFVPGLKAEGSAVYYRSAAVDEAVIADIAEFIGQNQ